MALTAEVVNIGQQELQDTRGQLEDFLHALVWAEGQLSQVMMRSSQVVQST